MMETRSCPLCGTASIEATVYLKENINPRRISDLSFSSRKIPEYMCYQLVQCPVCDLVYADQPPSVKELGRAYGLAGYDSSEEADDAAAAYFRGIKPIIAMLPRRESALEIGAGTGIFLDYLSEQGFTELIGVEPSHAAIAAAPERRRAWIREGMFEDMHFLRESFDFVCCFMTMEHVLDPNSIANAAFRLLRPGGVFVTVTHDYRSVVNRVLGKRSPIVDIEHLQLFSHVSIRCLFQHAGYTGITVLPFINTYSLRYWLRLMPIPAMLKNGISGVLHAVRADKIRLGFNVGNLIAAGFKI